MLEIYGIRKVDSSKYVYVGQTRVGVQKRFRAHLSLARQDDYRSLYQWIREVGEDLVVCDVIEISDSTDESWLDQQETFWILKLREEGHPLLNGDNGGSNGSQTKAAREKRIRKGEDHYNYGQTHSDETRARLSESRRNRPPASEETRAKMSEAQSGERSASFGKKRSAETRAKMSEAVKGRKASEETRHALRRGKHRYWHTDRGVVKPGCEFCESE